MFLLVMVDETIIKSNQIAIEIVLFPLVCSNPFMEFVFTPIIIIKIDGRIYIVRNTDMLRKCKVMDTRI